MAAPLAPYPRLQFFDGDGDPYPLSKLYTYVAGTTTPAATYSDSDLGSANSNPVVADADGRFGAIYLAASSYRFVFSTADDVVIFTADDIQDPGSEFASNFGTAMSAGSRNVATGYTLLTTDRLVTVSSSGATIFNLLPAASFTSQVTIKNMQAGTVVITPSGSDTVDSNSTWVLEAAADPVFPCVTLCPVTGGWLIVNSHRAA